MSPWAKLHSSGDDGALTTVTGFDHPTFSFLLGMFSPYYHTFTPWTNDNDGFTYKRINPRETRGRPRRASAEACLGLVLAWYRFNGSLFIMQGWFGLTGGQTSVWLRFGRRMAYKALLRYAPCRVSFPPEETIREYQRAIGARHEALPDVFCVADGLRLLFESCDGLDEQSICYNGWKSCHDVTNLFVFGPDGMIIDAVLNVPGCVHDSCVASWGGLHDRLELVYDNFQAVCTVDSAFAARGKPYLLRSSQDPHKGATPLEVARLNEATSLRQSAEWGMRAIQGSMPRLKEKIQYEENGERRLMLKLVPLLYNLRCERVGLNQLRNTYLPAWSVDADFYIRDNE